MRGLEKIVVFDMINFGLLKFYIRYVNNTMLIAKEDVIDNIVLQFNAYDANLKFPMDTFTDSKVHFLDDKTDCNENDLIYWTTH